VSSCPNSSQATFLDLLYVMKESGQKRRIANKESKATLKMRCETEDGSAEEHGVLGWQCH
jgi:hypothetical protein